MNRDFKVTLMTTIVLINRRILVLNAILIQIL